MMKTQDSSLRSASSRRESSPKENLQAKTIGCMPGIIRLLSKYHSSRKFLTFGKKQEKNGVGSSSTRSKSPAALIQSETKNGDKPVYPRKLSCNVPRSPTLPAEIRRSNSVDSPHICPTPPALVARLMGLEEGPRITPKTTAATAESASSQTRQQLLGALDKCDQDLKELKKIIDAVRAAQVVRSQTDHAVKKGMEANDIVHDDHGIKKRFHRGNLKGLEFNSEQPSPVSVLDESTRSPFSNHHHYYSRKQIVLNYGRAQTQQRQQQRKKPGEEDFINIPSIIDKITAESLHQKSHNVEASSPPWNSKAMIDSVAEVCRDIAWGERREIGRIGLALQEHIFKELIEETVTDMGFSCVYSLPFEACKRRLRF